MTVLLRAPQSLHSELRPRDREHGLEPHRVEWLHKRLVGLGHEANKRQQHFMAHSWFEVAYALKDGVPELAVVRSSKVATT